MALPSPRRLRTRVGFIGTGQVAEELGTAPCTCVLHVACARIGVPTDGSRPATCFVSAGLRVMIGSQQITRAQALAAQIGAEHSRWLGVMAMEAGNAGSGMQALKKHIRHPMARACACIHACLRPRLHSQYSASLHMSIHTCPGYQTRSDPYGRKYAVGDANANVLLKCDLVIFAGT